MSEPGDGRFVCIGCGASNPLGADVCAGCGYAFREPTPIPVTSVRISSANPYEAPTTKVGRAPTFRIGSAMAVIAVVALCLGAFAADISLGIFATIGLLPGTLRTMLVSARREAEGRPMGLFDQLWTFVLSTSAVVLIAASALIAFGLTCFPIGVSGGDLSVAVGFGAVVGLIVGIVLTIALLKAASSRARRERDRKQIRWR